MKNIMENQCKRAASRTGVLFDTVAKSDELHKKRLSGATDWVTKLGEGLYLSMAVRNAASIPWKAIVGGVQ